jgi:hypothetical protein
MATPAMDGFGLPAEAIRDEGMDTGDGAAEVEACWIRASETLGVVAFLSTALGEAQSPRLDFVQDRRVGRLGSLAEWAVERRFGLPGCNAPAGSGNCRLDGQPNPADQDDQYY